MTTSARLFAGLLLVFALAAAGLNVAASLYCPELPAQYHRELPAAARDWKISVPNDETGPARFGPLVLGGTSATATEDIDALGPPDPTPYDQTYFYYGLGLVITRPKPRAQRIAERGYYPKPAPTIQADLGYRVGAAVMPRIHEPPSDLSPEDKLYRLTQICFGNPNAVSVDDPIVKSCPFSFDNGVRLGDTREDVLHAFSGYSFQQERFLLYKTTLYRHGLRMEFFHDRLVAIVLNP